MGEIRFAAAADAAALLGIYGQYIDTPITFECARPSEEAFRRRVAEYGAACPYLVWEEDGRILGYAYAHRLGERAAYQWSAELSIYLGRDSTGRGLGRRLYGALMELLRLQGVRTAYGVVTMPNDASAALHQKLGFGLLGTYHNTGYKNGRWRDVVWFEKHIGSFDGVPEPIRPIGQLADREAVLRTI